MDRKKINKDFFTVKTSESAYILPKQNLHIMSKDFLLTESFNLFIGKIING